MHSESDFFKDGVRLYGYFLVEIVWHENTEQYFIDISDFQAVLASVLVSEYQAITLSRDLKIAIKR